MKQVLAALLLGIMLLVTPSAFAQDAKQVAAIEHVYKAVTLLYVQTESGGMEMLCTATAYKQIKGGYRFVSASHCVFGKTEAEQKSAKYFVSDDQSGSKTFMTAKLVEAGDKAVGDDFSIFEVQTDKSFDVVPLGDSDAIQLDDKVISVASPYGLGKQFFEGYVSMLRIDRPPLDAGVVKWHDAMLIVIGSAGGSSGSSIVSAKQSAIIAFLVGGTNSTIGAICIPVNQFKAFETKVDAGTYKKTKATDKLAEDAPEFD